MNEYVIRKSFTRKEVTLKTGKLKTSMNNEKDFKEDAETLLDFLQSEVTHGTIRELKKLLEEQRFWKMHKPTEETVELEVVGTAKRISKVSKDCVYSIRLSNGIEDLSVISSPTTLFDNINLCDKIEVRIKKSEEWATT